MKFPTYFHIFLLPLFVLGGPLLLFSQELSKDFVPSHRPLAKAHAHNDYEHKRPLLDALAAGFCSVESDIYLIDGDLLVAHDRDKVKPERTLQALYLEPLKQLVKRSGTGSVYQGKDTPPFYLLIDLKSEGETTYRALHSVLSEYQEILTEFRHSGETIQRAVTVIISGNRPKATMEKQEVRFAGYDGRLSDLGKGDTASLMPWISDNYRNHFKWKGTGEMPVDEKKKLDELVSKTHAEGKMLRLWAAPDHPLMWETLRSANVDLINSDKLNELSEHLKMSATSAPE